MKQHLTACEAIKETTKPKIIAVKVTTYAQDSVHSVEFFSYKSKFENPIDLREDFPVALGSNQSIEEIE